MRWNWLKELRKYALWAAVALVGTTGVARADDTADLKARVEAQQKQIDDLKKSIEDSKKKSDDKKVDGAPAIDEKAVQGIVADYLKDHPGAGMPAGVQTGYATSTGFTIRSPNDPEYVKWADEARIPFTLQIRGRIQLDYYNYKTTDNKNHQTGAVNVTADANANRVADFSQEEVKRMRLQFLGTMWDPNLRYFFEIDGNTRGLGAVQNNKVIQNAGASDPNGSPISNQTGGGAVVDHAVRLFQAYVAYDWHPSWSYKGCGPDCPDGKALYTPTVTLIAGKSKPLFGLEEYMGSANQQFVEYAMADWFFDADDDNQMMLAGVQVKARNDRFYGVAYVTNGNESQFANTQMDNYPGFNAGFWYDFGGTWNAQKQKYDLYGDCLADIDYSCKPVVRVGGSVNIVPMNRRSLYGDDEQSRIFMMPGGPNGTRLINVLDGGTGAGVTNAGANALDKVDSNSFDTWISGKWHGFSLTNEWWCRDLTSLAPTAKGPAGIVYSVGSTNYLYPQGKALFDYGTMLQGGYFVVPKKIELVARWSWIRGESGDVFGDGKIAGSTNIAGVGKVNIAENAFKNFHEASEYAVGVNYYFHRQLLKWQTDVSLYQGGNPAGGGSSPAGFIPGLDGYLIRSQLQLAF